MTGAAETSGEISLSPIIASLRDKGWAQVTGRECSIDMLREIFAKWKPSQEATDQSTQILSTQEISLK